MKLHHKSSVRRQVALDVQDVHAMFSRHIACLAGEFVDAYGFREAEGRVPPMIGERWGRFGSQAKHHEEVLGFISDTIYK